MKQRLGVDVSGSYAFNKTAKTVTFSGLPVSINLGNILLINNATANTIIYSFASQVSGAVSFTNNVLTLDYNTSSMNDSDILQIWLDIPDNSELVSATEALRMAISAMTRTIGWATPDTTGQLRVALSSVPNMGTLTTLSNITSVGGYNANDHVPAMMHLQADSLRRNISVS